MKKIISSLFIILISIVSIQSSIIRLYSEDEMELCYGNLYVDWSHNMINIKYLPSYIPFRYNFVNSTFSVDEVKDYVFFTRSLFLKHRYSSSNTSLVITLTGNVYKQHDQCSVNVSCFIKNLITSTSAILTSKDGRLYTVNHQKSCVIVMGYDTILQYRDQIHDVSDAYDFTIYLLSTVSILIVLIYVINKIKMNS
ncbi:type I membrane glycoprotein [Raccoonpox virus]|uniref:Putative type-I membrane glycoprotein n=1 Tax=Raccoon poxvirus TaxID=10256 RepID=A0A0G3FXW8_RACVI|nr:putative type-I membrane glycoprotein [Raccoonpox virus]AKJ93793.1 putative type-I membrane glycoprotein [Raccoonpox virus]AOP31425.1 type I membrane glycoprotein [Raccoonpox virus]